jgi:hypothetical protein
MKTVFLNKITRIFLFPLFLIFLFSVSFLYTNAQINPYPEQKKGSINVCVLIVDGSGKILNDSTLADLPFFSFEFPILKGETYLTSKVIERAYFNKPYFSLNTSIFSDSTTNDAVCILFDDLDLGSYFYQKEITNQENEWFKPLYNDQYSADTISLKDFFTYTGGLFNSLDDTSENFNLGRQIVLTKNRPDRTLVVLNQYKNGQDVQAKCSSDVNNIDGGFDCGLLNAENNKSTDFSKKNLDEKKIKKEKHCNYLSEYLRIDQNNNPAEVKKLQIFLRDYEGFLNLRITGVFDKATFNAVSAFQVKYKDDILTPWGAGLSTGYVYITTKKKVNEIYCQFEIPLTEGQIKEINKFKEGKVRAVEDKIQNDDIRLNDTLRKKNTTKEKIEGKNKVKVVENNSFEKNNGSGFPKQNINDIIGLNSENASSTNLIEVLAEGRKKQIPKVENLANIPILGDKGVTRKISNEEALTVTSVVLGGKFVSSGLFWIFLIFFSVLVYFYFKYRKTVENNNISENKSSIK